MAISEYLCAALGHRTLPRIIKNAIKFLRNVKFDSIAVRGISGSIVVSAIALELDKDIIAIRKNTDNTHSAVGRVEYSAFPKRYIIVDDFISTGETIKTIIENIEEDTIKYNYKCECIGVFLYCQPDNGEAQATVDEINNELGLKIKLFSSFV